MLSVKTAVPDEKQSWAIICFRRLGTRIAAMMLPTVQLQHPLQRSTACPDAELIQGLEIQEQQQTDLIYSRSACRLRNTPKNTTVALEVQNFPLPSSLRIPYRVPFTQHGDSPASQVSSRGVAILINCQQVRVDLTKSRAATSFWR